MNSDFLFQSLDAKISRRKFLQFCGLGFTGAMLPGKFISQLPADSKAKSRSELLGRVTQEGLKLFEAPDYNSDIIQTMEMDSLWRITSAALNKEQSSPNQLWYALEGIGFAHSSRIQPVKNSINITNTTIPEKGCVGEITVPFIDAYNTIEENRLVVYRFYYGSTFWVLERLTGPGGRVWYKLLDDYNYGKYFVPAYALRLIPESELTAISSNVEPEDKHLVVDLSTQSLTAYEGEKVVFMTRISSGVRLKEGGFRTPRGHFRTTRKRPCRHMVTRPSEFGSGFDLPGVPWVSYFTSDGVALHGTYWHNDFGVPHSHGCINMASQAAKWVYRWTMPNVPPDEYIYSDTLATRIIVQ